MNTCGTCAYFGEAFKLSTFREGAVDPVYHPCLLIEHINDAALAIYKQEVAGVTDGSGYAATFCVTDEFGCNQWMPK